MRESGVIDQHGIESYYDENVLMRNCQRKLGREVWRYRMSWSHQSLPPSTTYAKL